MAITRGRITSILAYIAYCHDIQIKDGPRYSRQQVKENTTDKFENYLKKRLVHDYLKKNKKAFSAHAHSAIEDVSFECEPEMPYKQFDKQRGKEREANDRIDIKVNRLGLQHAWKDTDEQDIYLAIECKIMNTLQDNNFYQDDMQKFCDRNYLQFRLPVEAMLGFKESKSLAPAQFIDNLNERLRHSEKIETVQLVQPDGVQASHAESFSSSHRRNFEPRLEFTICHLYLDYSRLIEV